MKEELSFDTDGPGQAVILNLTDRELVEAELRALNESLEERVAERTAELERRAEQLRLLALELTKVEQRERRRVALILHDHLQQFLAAARLRMHLALQHISEEQARREMATADGLLTEAIGIARSLTVELSPPVLREGGLGRALEWLAEQMQEKHGLAVTVESDPQAEPQNEDLAEFLFSGARELLFNVVKHAGIREAKVRLSRGADGRVLLAVSDAGAGVDPALLDQWNEAAGGFGLFSLRERLEAMGGSLEIRSAPGQGTHVVLALHPASEWADGR